MWSGRSAIALAFRLVLIALASLMSVVPTSAQTLERIRERGLLICGATGILPAFSQNIDGRWSGFDVDLCRALAAAIFGDPNLVEFRPLNGDSRFVQLQTGAIDIVIRNAPWTIRRDTTFDAQYVTTTFFDGQAFLVPESLGLVSAYELDNVTVCVIDGGEEQQRMRDFFFEIQASYEEVPYEDLEDLGAAYRAGLCNAVTGSGRWLYAIRRALDEPAIHRILPERISKELLGPVVADGDENWFDIVRWTIFGLIDAEELGVTSLNIEQMKAARNPSIQRLLGLQTDFGTPLGLTPTFMADAIRLVGNYAEIYDRNFGPQTGAALLRGLNSLWGNGGLLYAPPIR